MSEGLSVRDLLKTTYDKLAEQHPHKTISFPREISTEIANDSDWHRARAGYMGYSEVKFLTVGDKKWIVGRGEKCGSYPGDQFDSDLLAIKIDRELSEEAIQEKIERSEYFRNTLVIGMADGNLGIQGKDKFGGKMFRFLEEKVSGHISQKAVIDRNLLTMDLRPVCKSPTMYKTGLVDVLVSAINDVLTA